MKLHRSLVTFCVLIYVLIVLGGTVRNLGAGLSCPDWPLCFGKIIPPFDVRIYAEYIHRLVAGLVSILTLALTAVILKNSGNRALLGKNIIFAVVLLAAQVVLGGLTVLQLLKSEIVTLHLVAGSLFFATAIVMALKTRQPHGSKALRESQLARWGAFTTVSVFLQMILGAMVSSHFAGLACPDFPTCLGLWWPGFGGLAGIHFTHRLGAVLVFFIVLSFAVKVLRQKSIPHVMRRRAWVICALLVVQWALGISNIIFHLPVAVSVAHLGVAEALFGLLLITTYEIRHLELR